MSKKNIGFAITGSFCTHEKIKGVVRKLVEDGNRVIPIFSNMSQAINSRFGDARDFIIAVQEITGEHGIFTLQEAEPIGPKAYLDVMIIAPCTGNTMAKLCAGITDSPVLMAAKAHMRNEKPVVIAVSTNDALGANLKNIGELMNTKNVYFVPFGQDDYDKKPKSMVAHFEMVPDTIEEALKGKQIQPVIRSPFEK
ncbi:MAG: dipicolinate synthase subunit B [Eubacterium sp.]|jgi:dipicolinic acid synthetase, B subunit|nr:dipicolinate synthase subunit B [Eubacterium sp.]